MAQTIAKPKTSLSTLSSEAIPSSSTRRTDDPAKLAMIHPVEFAVRAAIDHHATRPVIRMSFHLAEASWAILADIQLVRIDWRWFVVGACVVGAKRLSRVAKSIIVNDVAATVLAKANLCFAFELSDLKCNGTTRALEICFLPRWRNCLDCLIDAGGEAVSVAAVTMMMRLSVNRQHHAATSTTIHA